MDIDDILLGEVVPLALGNYERYLVLLKGMPNSKRTLG